MVSWHPHWDDTLQSLFDFSCLLYHWDIHCFINSLFKDSLLSVVGWSLLISSSIHTIPVSLLAWAYLNTQVFAVTWLAAHSRVGPLSAGWARGKDCLCSVFLVRGSWKSLRDLELDLGYITFHNQLLSGTGECRWGALFSIVGNKRGVMVACSLVQYRWRCMDCYGLLALELTYSVTGMLLQRVGT